MGEDYSIRFQQALEELSTLILLSSPDEPEFQEKANEFLGIMRSTLPCEQVSSLVDEIAASLDKGDVDAALSILGGPWCEDEPEPADTNNATGAQDEDLMSDDDLISEFVSGTESHLERIEELALELEQGEIDGLREIKGRIHTIKGEAGALGYGTVEEVCHQLEDTLEDHLESDSVPAREIADLILTVKDWVAGAIAAISEGRQIPEKPDLRLPDGEISGDPQPWLPFDGNIKHTGDTGGTDDMTDTTDSSRQTAQDTRQPAGDSTTASGSRDSQQTTHASDSSDASDASPSPVTESEEKTPAEPAAPSEPESFEWDPDTVEMVGDFVAEATEGLSRIDEILLAIETEGLTMDEINEMFRVFHSIKGVAGFLEIEEIQKFAHTTETLLNKARQEEITLEGPYLDVIFDATAVMRKIVTELPEAVENSRRPHRDETYFDTLNKLQKAIDGKLEDTGPAVEVSPGEKLGEILVKNNQVDEDKLDKALKRQELTERPLGEELVKMGAVEPKAVAKALRAQKTASTPPEAQEEKSGQHPKTSKSLKHPKIKETVKVDLERIEHFMAMIGELVIVESMVSNAPELQEMSSISLRNHLGQLAKITRDLQDISMSMRLVPVKGLFQKMARMVRDLSRKSGKQIRLVSEGETTEIDRKMVEQLSDPLVHMIRNAADHGIEPAQERIAAGKDPTGTIRLSAYHQGGQIIIEIQDDGRGLDRQAILDKAIRQGLVSEQRKLTDQEIYNLIFLPGFSTAKRITEISGRGVGMDVVKRNIEAIRGKVLIDSVPGQGTTFKIILPLTTAIIDGMIVRCGTERYIIPTMSIIESLRPDPGMVKRMASKQEILNVRGEIVPLVRLGEVLDVEGYERDPAKALVVLVETYSSRIGLLVDEVLQQQQIVIKTIYKTIQASNLFSGAAIMADGRVGLIINTEELVNHVTR